MIYIVERYIEEMIYSAKGTRRSRSMSRLNTGAPEHSHDLLPRHGFSLVLKSSV